MSRDAAIESWLASMSESELIDQCFLWHDMALEHGRMYNAVKNENAKLRDENQSIGMAAYELGRNSMADENAKLREACAELLKMVECHDPEWLHWPEMHDELRELGVEVNA